MTAPAIATIAGRATGEPAVGGGTPDCKRDGTCPASAGVSPLRVLFVDYSFGFGGAIRSLSLTLGALENVEAYVATSQDRHVAKQLPRVARVFAIRRLVNYRLKERVAAAFDDRILRAIVLKCLAAGDFMAMVVNALRLVSIIRRYRVELLHLNNGFTPQEALLAARMTGVRCIVHLRDFQGEPARVMGARTSAVRHIITVSDAVARGLRGTVVGECLTTTIHDPVDLDMVDAAASCRNIVRQRHGLADGDVAIGIFGRLVHWKGQREFVGVASPVLARFSNARVFVVGDESDGRAGYLAEVRERAAASGFGDRFIFTGYRADVDAYFAAMDIVVHASITPEPFGMVVAEAMAAGCAVVAIDAGGPAEVITHGVDGLLVPRGDGGAMTDAIASLVADPRLRGHLGRAARSTIRRRFGTDSNANRIARVYETVLGSRAGNAALASEESR